MARIIFELDDIEDIKNRLESIIQRGEKIDSSDFKKLIKQKQTAIAGLDKYEEKVFEYIRNNPGTSNQDVVNALIKDRSRGPVFKIIKKLVKYGLVIEKPDDTNAQRHQLFENKESLIIRVENDIKNFKKSYLNLIKRANLECQKKQHELRGSSRPHMSPEIYSAIVDIDLTRILEQLIKGYSLKAIFEWPGEVKDSESLNRLYLMVFHMLGDIFSEHVKYSIPFGIQDEHERVTLLHEGFQDSFGEPTIYRDLMRDFNEYNWNTVFDSVMSDLFTALNMGMKWKDYRAGLVKDTKKHS